MHKLWSEDLTPPVNSVVDEILPHENEKLSAAKEPPKHAESDFDENELYYIDTMSLENTKEFLEWCKRLFGY